MSRQVIAIDFDDVIATFNRAYIEHHNRVHQVPRIEYDLVDSYDFTEVYGVDAETMAKRVRTFCLMHHDDIVPWKGVKEALAALSQDRELHVVTSRCESLTEVTEAWLVKHDLRQYFASLHFTNGFGSLYPERRRSKSSVCTEIGARVLIEDAAHNAAEVANTGVLVLLPDRPWNRGFAHRGIVRFNEWNEVPLILRG